MPRPLVTAVIVNWNARRYLPRAVETVLDNGPGPRAEVVVVDCGSTDGSPEELARAFPTVRLIRTANRGYGAGANAGVRWARTPLVAVLNPDLELRPGSLAAWVELMAARPRVGCAGALLYGPDGLLQPSHHLEFSVLVEVWDRLVVNRIPAQVHDSWLRRRYRRPERVFSVPGVALCFRTQAFREVGGFDERLFLYYEEPDLSQRLAARGWEVWCAPGAQVVHFGGQSTGQVPEFAYRQARLSRIHYYRQHRPWWEWRLVEWYARRQLAALDAR